MAFNKKITFLWEWDLAFREGMRLGILDKHQELQNRLGIIAHHEEVRIIKVNHTLAYHKR